MTIEPYAVRTVCIRPVMPPKENKPFVPPPPGFLFQDAKRCNARLNRDRGCIETGQAANAIRMIEAEARRAKTAEAVLALLQAGPCSRVQIQERLHLTEATARNALTRLRDEGRADFRKGAGNVAIWRAL